MTTHEAESQLLEQDQENYIARNPNRDTKKKRKGGLHNGVCNLCTIIIIIIEDMIDHRSFIHNLSSCDIKAWKNVVCKTAMINHVFISFSTVQI